MSIGGVLKKRRASNRTVEEWTQGTSCSLRFIRVALLFPFDLLSTLYFNTAQYLTATRHTHVHFHMHRMHTMCAIWLERGRFITTALNTTLLLLCVFTTRFMIVCAALGCHSFAIMLTNDSKREGQLSRGA